MSTDRFEFGRNWQSYARLIDDEAIHNAEDGLGAILGTRALSGQTFLDIGCGSGLHALAALRLGAKYVLAVDLDPHSVATTQAVLQRFGPYANSDVRCISVFDLQAAQVGEFDIVYSWGVLHHTGSMYRAIAAAAARVTPGGLFAVALYRKTRYCAMWTRIKRWYINASPEQQARAERLLVRLYGLFLLLRGQRLATYVAGYKQKRGMDYYHDVRDWIGGYPYESITPDELDAFLKPRGFELVRRDCTTVHWFSGLFGSGNDKYLYRRRGLDA